MSRWSLTTSQAELCIVAEYGSANPDKYIRAASRADDGRDPTQPPVATGGGVREDDEDSEDNGGQDGA